MCVQRLKSYYDYNFFVKSLLFSSSYAFIPETFHLQLEKWKLFTVGCLFKAGVSLVKGHDIE